MSEFATATCEEKQEPPTMRDTLAKVKELLAAGEDDAVVAVVAELVANNAGLKRQLEELGGKKFKTSEMVSSAQLRLLFAALAQSEERSEVPKDEALHRVDEAIDAASTLEDELEEESEESGEAEEEPTKQEPTKKAGRTESRFPTVLRRVPNPIRVPEGQRACPCCKGERVCIGQDTTEVLELVPSELVVREDRREKLWCPKCEGELCRAPLGDKVVARGQLGPHLVACVLVEKYRDGLPLHRQVERFGRMGYSMGVSTLVDQVRHAAKVLGSLHAAAVRAVLAAHVMQLDGTGLAVQDRDHPKGRHLGSLWCYVGDEKVAAFQYTSTGKKLGQKPDELGPEDMLARRVGWTVADASGLFDKSFERPDLIECGCNAHARRKFVEALEGKDSRAVRVIAAYKKLYAIERKIRKRKLDGAAKLEYRQQHSKPVFDAILKWCQAYRSHVPPSSALGRAVRYFQNHHVALGRFLEDPAVPIDNNIVERQQVRVALTRKNFLFVGNDEGGKRAAIVYTLLASCALNEVDPGVYLRDVLPRLQRGVLDDQLRDLLPDRWKLAQPGIPAADPATA